MVTEVESKLLSAEEALVAALNEEISGQSTSAIPATSPAQTPVLHRRLIDVKHRIEVRHTELEVAVEMSEKFDNKLHDVSDRLDDIAHDTETNCQLPHGSEVELQQQKVPCQ